MNWWQIAALVVGVMVMLVCVGMAVLMVVAACAIREDEDDD